MKKITCLIVYCMMLSACNAPAKTGKEQEVYNSKELSIHKVSEHVYEHTSFLSTQDFGKVSCNGMIVVNQKEAIIFDTPCDDAVSEELINWVVTKLHAKIIAVIPTHYHIDNLGGLKSFHQHQIPSYAYRPTITLAQERNFITPQHAFDSILELAVGDLKVYAQFVGEGHTADNTIGYFPAEDIMFGGCLIKEMGAGKGNLAEANTADWPATAKKLKAIYPQTKIVIPGHGRRGGPELIDYTIELFE